MTLADACVTKDAEAAASQLRQRYLIALDADEMRKVFGSKLYQRRMKCDRWSCGSWASWMRNRIEDLFPEKFSGAAIEEPGDTCTCEFNVFFLNLVETEEMLDRLRRPEPLTESRVARSRIGRTPEFVTPIDGVAWRVAPTEVH